MLEELKEEEIVNKVGGRFKLSTIIQKRMVALNRGARPLVEIPTKNLMKIVIQEILEDKIYLDRTGNVAIKGEVAPDVDEYFDAGPGLDDLA
ncbi:DNA-directed RNA polymerase subunit omega [Rubinisphaera sp.]|uniref:DNA-directed RNA polymerase subunit omega n=1 Tax=Rubinisphaera sp. TaxID=2024857 RepID=UPI000C114DAD|nr:DNA-directed RNA polymerase subunit omega [Rubinisphaera sp.]MBV12260.1 DNA-directed RNA polymerase subunit omega [Rubinisphaera sp.]HCS53835.1 DNA-directed RNA polymerase subunit omega [Planctomycetaceae bacterium]|tara:strand:- start:178 stop:453 length:276 start_codon:yes stop_codon:yes gene_type:complete